MRYYCAVVLLLSFCSVFENANAQHPKTDSLLHVLPGMKISIERIDVLNQVAFRFAVTSSRDAEKFVKEALALSRELQYKKGLAESLKVLGVIHLSKSEFSVSAEYSYQSLKLYEELQDKSGQSRVLNNLALVYNAQHDFDRVYEFTLRSLRLKREVGDSGGVANSFLALTEYYRQTKNYSQAQFYGKEAMKRFESMGRVRGMSHASLQLGEVYADEGNFSLASIYFKDAIHFARLSHDHLETMAAYKNLGRLLLQSGRLDSVYYYLKQSQMLARRYDSKGQEMLAAQELSEYFRKINQWDSALYYFQLSAGIERSIFNSEKQQQLATLQLLYDFEKKEQEIGFQKKIVRRQYFAIAGVTLILILTVFIGFKFYYLNRTNLKAKEDLLKLNMEINSMNENLEQLVQTRTEEIKLQNQRLIDYAFFTAHEVRGPLARILGLIELAKLKDVSDEDKDQIMARLEETANELDEVIRVINRKLENSKY